MLKSINPNKIFYLSKIFDPGIQTPWTVEIQPTNICNLNCSFCAYAKRKKENPVQLSQLGMDNLVESIKKMGVKGVYISGGGESLLWKSKEHEISDYIIELSKNSDLAIITNGTLLSEDNLEAVKHCFYVMVSLYNPRYSKNGMSENTFNKVLGNITSLVSWKKDAKAKLPFIIIKIIIDENNYNHIPEIYREAKSLGADNIIFRLARNYEGKIMEITPEQKEELRSTILEMKEEINTDSTNLFDITAELSPKISNPLAKEPQKCWIVDLGLYAAIDPVGDVYPCLFYSGNKDYSIGNINITPLENLWGGKLHQRIIEKLQKQITGEMCKGCRFMRYNEEIAGLKKDFIEAHASFI